MSTKDTNPDTTDNLSHAGIKGMKWGVRRFQNSDGTLTEAGKKRYYQDTKDLSDKKKAKYKPEVDKWVNDDMRNTKALADESKKVLSDVERHVDSSIRNAPKHKLDLSNMSDQQMRNEINRALLERQYNDIFAPKQSTRGREVVKSILSISGGVLGTASSALGIALLIKQLRG